MADHLRMCAFS